MAGWLSAGWSGMTRSLHAGSLPYRSGDAFYYTGLTSITIPNSVTSIGFEAFSFIYLTNVSILSGVTSIGYGAFDNCASLTAIMVNSNNPDYSSVNGVLFNKSQTDLVEYRGGLTGSYTIPNTVTSIGGIGSAFAYCSRLTNVEIPNRATGTGSGAFFGSSEKCES